MGEIIVEEPSSVLDFEAKGIFQSLFYKLHQFQQDETLCDVEIRTARKSILCHRVVLACCSPYFRAMFTTPLVESRQKVITISDIDDLAMEQLIKFVYTAKVQLSTTNVQALLHAASVLQFDALAQACCDFISAHLHPSNCLGIRQFAERHGLATLVRQADEFACSRFLEVIQSDEFPHISGSHLQELISSENLNVEKEVQVYETVMKWVNYDISGRKDHLPQLLSNVRLPFIQISYLRSTIESEELLHSSIECRDLLDEAKNYHLWLANRLPDLKPIDNPRMRTRKSYAGVLFCVGGRGASGDPFSSIECYDCLKNCWFRIIDMNIPRRHVGCVMAEGKVYAVGGCDGKHHLSSTEVYDPATNEWVFLTPMAIPRRGLGLCSLMGALYAVGGLDNSGSFETVERYDISLDTWFVVANMNTARGGVAVAVLWGYIYALGGGNGSASLNSCERYDPHLNKWTFISPMNQRRAGAGAAVLDDHLYVVGGFDNNLPLNSVERYNPETDSWSPVTPMSICRGGVGVAALGGKLYAVGGHNGSHYLSVVEMYDPLSNRWERAAGIAICRAGAGITWCPFKSTELYELNRQYNETPEPEKQKSGQSRPVSARGAAAAAGEHS